MSKREDKNKKRLALIAKRKAAIALSEREAIVATVPSLPVTALPILAAVLIDKVADPVADVSAMDAPAAEVLSPPKPAEDGPGVEGVVIRKARIYAKPVNQRLRLIEFEDGSHGKLWVRADAAPMLNWLVHVRPSGLVRGDWELHGRYNWKGTRMQ